MTEGAYVHSLGRYILVQRCGPTVKRIYFSDERPAETLGLAEEIVAHLECGTPCPKAELDLSICTEFQKRIYAVVGTIPRGQTMTYGAVAASAGSPKAARAVGRAMAANPFAILVPCHRVVAKNGLGGYAFGREIKEMLLLLEREQFLSKRACS